MVLTNFPLLRRRFLSGSFGNSRWFDRTKYWLCCRVPASSVPASLLHICNGVRQPRRDRTLMLTTYFLHGWIAVVGKLCVCWSTWFLCRTVRHLAGIENAHPVD